MTGKSQQSVRGGCRAQPSISGMAFHSGAARRSTPDMSGGDHHRQHETRGLAERRLVEGRVRGPQPGWKLLGTGSVGSQALTGIPDRTTAARRSGTGRPCQGLAIRDGLCDRSRECDDRALVVLAEIYPSLVANQPPRESEGFGSVRAIGLHFRWAGRGGALARRWRVIRGSRRRSVMSVATGGGLGTWRHRPLPARAPKAPQADARNLSVYPRRRSRQSRGSLDGYTTICRPPRRYTDALRAHSRGNRSVAPAERPASRSHYASSMPLPDPTILTDLIWSDGGAVAAGSRRWDAARRCSSMRRWWHWHKFARGCRPAIR